MTCSHCAKHEASVFFKQILSNKVTELHLCDACAQEAGIASTPVSLGLELLFGGPPTRDPAATRAACPACGLRYAEFRQSGRLGCASCYEAFAQPLADALRRVHGSLRHAGKTPDSAAAQSAERLREHLKAAIRAEDFEAAAKLRDGLRALEG